MHTIWELKTMGSRIKIFGEDVSGRSVEETAGMLADDLEVPVLSETGNGVIRPHSVIWLQHQRKQAETGSGNTERQTLERRRLLPETGRSYGSLSGRTKR